MLIDVGLVKRPKIYRLRPLQICSPYEFSLGNFKSFPCSGWDVERLRNSKLTHLTLFPKRAVHGSHELRVAITVLRCLR